MASRVSLLLLQAGMAMAADLPVWLKEAAAAVPAYGPTVPAVVLLNQESVTVEEGGRHITTTRQAVKILTRLGRPYAAATEYYRADSAKVRSFGAWMRSPAGRVIEYGGKETLDIAVRDDAELYSQLRRRVINAADDADPGSVFGYEVTTEEKTVFTQFLFAFQGLLPVVRAQFSVTLPGGWTARSATLNRDAVEPSVSGSNYTWQLENLPYIDSEPVSPARGSVVPMVGVSYFPAAGAKAPGKALGSWGEVSSWLASIQSASFDSGGAVARKAQELTANQQDQWEKVKALAAYAQAIRYVSIQLGLARGGGYIPNPAPGVLTRGYGDCKDKANLLRSLLKAIGTESFLVTIYSGDRGHVKPGWASPYQFNHAILAIRAPEGVRSPAIVEGAELGRLLLFDPTDEYTPFGHLPATLQGSHALIVAESNGALVRVPLSPAAAADHRREIEVVLASDGSAKGTVVDRYRGGAFAEAIAMYRSLTQREFENAVERRFARNLAGATVSGIEAKVASGGEEFEIRAQFQTPIYAMVPNDTLMAFRAAALRHGSVLQLPDIKARKLAVELDGGAFEETVRVALPAVDVDELPEPVVIAGDFGKFESSWNLDGGRLVFHRRLETPPMQAPARDYARIRGFFESVRMAGEKPVVLKKRAGKP